MKMMIQTTLIVAAAALVDGFHLPHLPSHPLTTARASAGARLRLQTTQALQHQRQQRDKQQQQFWLYTSTLPQQEFVEEDAPAEVSVSRRTKLAPLIVKEDDVRARDSKPATVASASVNLIKTILGTGVLALPAGLAAVSDHPAALVPASALLLVLGALSAYTFQLYGRLTHETQAKNMGEIWERTVGTKSSWVISAATLSFCGGIALVYSLVIGDFLSSLAMTALGSGVPAMFVKRQFWILSVTLSTLIPLCNLKSLAALAPMSVLGTVGTLLTALFMAIRCPAIIASSPYSVAPGATIGKFAAAATPALAPKFGTYSKIISPGALIIASMAMTAYLGHFNAPAFYHGFKQQQPATEDGDNNNNNDEKAISNYNKITLFGFAGCTIMNILMLAFGFLTFGGNASGVIINNYATADKGAILSRLLMTLSVVGGYPFMVGGCKAGFVELYNKFKKGKVECKETVEKRVAQAVLFLSTSLALLVNDAGLVVSFIGALLGSCIIYVFPTLMFLSHTGKQLRAGARISSRKLKLERLASRFLLTFGIASGLIGAAVSVINSCAPHLLC